MNSFAFAASSPSPAGAPKPPVQFDILCLNRPEHAAISATTQRPVLWISSQPPQTLLGLLGQTIEGAWYEPGKVVVSLQGRTFAYPVAPLPGTQLHDLLQTTLGMHLAGVSPNAIQNVLSSATLQPAFA